jgi:LPS export ABC transporter protein LptC
MPAAWLLLGVLLGVGGCARGTDDPADDDAAARAVDPGYSATRAQVIETDASGAPRYTLTADSIQQDPQSLEVTLGQLSMQVADGDQPPWRMTARSGRMPEDASRIDLSGDVRVAGRIGGGAEGDGERGEPIEIRSDALSYEMASSLARSASDVTIRLSGKWLQARGIEANLKARQVRLESQVHGRFAP